MAVAVKGFLSFRAKCIYHSSSIKIFAPIWSLLIKWETSRKGAFLVVDVLTSAIASIDCFFAFKPFVMGRSLWRLATPFCLLSYIVQSITLFSKSSTRVYISTVLGLLLPEFTYSTITHSFGSGPIMSGTFSWTFSKVSVAISCGIFFCFRSSCRWS